jgi:hypothetical protein
MGANRTVLDDAAVTAAAGRALAAEPSLSRTQLSRRVCGMLGWRTVDGRLKEMECRVALNRLERQGHVALPPSRGRLPRPRHRRRGGAGERLPRTVFAPLRELGRLELVRVSAADEALSAAWQELTARHHYLGSGPLCGRQLRYLVRSERFGTVGTLAFTSPALHLAARDAWIGWDDEGRRLHLEQVVCNARFLILPWFRVENLASKVLGLCPERVREDWRETYGVEPVLLETFVNPRRFKGTCYRAAGWQEVGSTAGRGRQDRKKRFAAGRKRVLLLPLRPDCRERLRETPPKPPAPVYYKDDSGPGWEQVEFGAADLGDARRNRRLAQLAAAFFGKPTANIPEACGSPAAARAAYRLLKHGKTDMRKILAPHYEATAGRLAAGDGVVLAVQDTTFLNYSAHPATEDLGPIGSTEGGPVGLVLHDTMAFTPEGTPLGLVDIQCWARDPEAFGLSEFRKDLPTEEKESAKWLESYAAASVLQRRVPGVRVVSVGDREADFHDLFERACHDPLDAGLLVRAVHNRTLLDECLGLKDWGAGRPVAAVVDVRIPRRGASPARTAAMELRYGTVTLLPPKGPKGRAGVQMQVVHIVEQTPRKADEPVEWFLLTTCPVESADQACEKVQWYSRRWGIEVFHRILKSGCRIEDRQLGTQDRLENCLAIDLVVAWRVFHLTMLGREFPDLPCTACLDDIEWKVLCTHHTGAVPAQPPSMRQAVIWIGRLGGYIARPKDYLPGALTLWRGLITLQAMAAGWRLALGLEMPEGP